MYLDWRKNAGKMWVVDTEANSLQPTQFWCAVAKNLGTKEVIEFNPEAMYDGRFRNFIEACSFIIGHNFISFDSYHLNKLGLGTVKLNTQIDSLVLSYLYHPHLPGGHSLEAYGDRFGLPKLGHEDWTHFSPEMMSRCKRDVEINEAVYLGLCDRMNKIGFSERSCEIEHQFHHVIDKQQHNGFYFNKPQAEELVARLDNDLLALEKPIKELFPATLEAVKTYDYRLKQDGTPFASYLRHKEDYDAIEFNEDGSQYTTYSYKEFNIGSPPQRVDKLLSLGWTPEHLTKGGGPKIDGDALKKFAETSGDARIQKLADWIVNSSRRSTIQSWIDCVASDGRIHGTVFSCGASSRRCRHNNPNTANIPAADDETFLGYEVRSLWTVEDIRTRCLVDYDASGLEMRGFGHFIGGGKPAELYIFGKPHVLNAENMSTELNMTVSKAEAKKCVPLDTTILTRRGWKHYNELVIGEEVLGYNTQTGYKEWTKLTNITTLEAEVFKISNSHKTLRATGNHRWFVNQRKKSNSKKSYLKPYMVFEERETLDLNSESNIIINAPFNPDQDNISNVKGLDGKYDVDWVQRVLNMSQPERTQFLQGFLLADGYINKNTGNWHWDQNKNNLSEGALIASYLVHNGYLNVSETNGYNHNMISVGLSKKSHMTCQKINIESEGVQPVWCPTTELGSWVMRQGNFITITGNSFYSMIYGAWDKRLGNDLRGAGEALGGKVRKVLYRTTPGLEAATEAAQEEWEDNHGLLSCIDGGFVRCKSKQSALNYKIQPLGAIIMKVAAIKLDKWMVDNKVDSFKVADVHDEGILDTLNEKELAEAVGRQSVKGIEEAGEEFNLKVPLTGEFKIGYTWAEVH